MVGVLLQQRRTTAKLFRALAEIWPKCAGRIPLAPLKGYCGNQRAIFWLQADPLFIYWLLFAYFAAGTFARSEQIPSQVMRPAMLFGALLMIGVIGLRFQVGADWRTYQAILRHSSFVSFGDALARGDPAYQAINWAVVNLGYGLWLVNVICGALFVWGLTRLASRQPSPFLAIAVAVPYLVIVVAMGYTRQAAAIGIAMAGLAAFERSGSVIRFALYVAVAALFHKTAVVILPLVIFSGRHNRLANFLAGVALSYLLYDTFLSNSVNQLVTNYVSQKYDSQGAAIRVIMNIVPAALFLITGNKMGFLPSQASVWRSFSIVAFLLLIALLISPSSTAIDRIALYIIPLQIVIFSRLYKTFEKQNTGKTIIILYAAAVQFTWLNFAVHSKYWIPYHFYPFNV